MDRGGFVNFYHVDFSGDGSVCYAQFESLKDAVEFAKSLGNSFLSLHCFRAFKKLEKSNGGVWQLVAEYNQDGTAKH